MVRKTITFLFPFYLIFVLLTSCDITGKNRKKPASTGQPYEVVLEGDTDSIGCRITVDGEIKSERISNQVNAYTFCVLKAA